MTEWREYKLSDVMEIIGGGTPKTSVQEYWNGNIPWLSVADFNNANRYVYVAEKHITELGLKNSSTKILKKGQLIISARGTVGAIAQLGYDMAFNQSCYGLTANSLSTNDFLFYLLKQCIEELKQQSNGGVFDTIIRETFDNIIISLPPLPEQKAIAEVLSSLDDKIDLLTRQNKTLEDLGQAFFRKWFVEDADEKLKKYPLSELMVIQNGFAFRSRDYQDAGKYKIVTIKNVQDGFIDTSGTTFLNQLPVGMPDYVLLTIGDVLISLTGNVGRVGIVVEDNLLLNQRVAKISPYNPEYLPFLYFYFRNETTREYLINLAHGTAQANLSPIETLKTEVSFSKTLIKKYSELFMPMYQKIIKNKQQIIVLQKLRDTLLPKLISGEVRVKL
jgi:type I restriction enzyme S subunit